MKYFNTKSYLPTIEVFSQKVCLIALIFVCLSSNLFAEIDSLKSKKAPLFFGINLGKDVSYSGIYSPRNNTLLGFSFGVKNLILRTNANYVNRDLFEAHNYIIGGRDRRTLPLSGFDITVLFVRHLLNNKILHPMIGFTYRKSVIYGGWRNEILISSYGNNIPVARVVNFNDKFHQISSVFGLYFSSKNKFGYSFSCPIGVNIQNNTNSHYGEQVDVNGSSSHKEFVKKGNQAGLNIGLNFNIFYHFNYLK